MRALLAILLFAPVLYALTAPRLTFVEIDPGVPRHWSPLIRAWYPGAVVVSAHGFDQWGRWCMRSGDGQRVWIETVLLTIRAQYPDRRIVVISCNPGGRVVDMPNVTYPMGDVWIVPDAWLGSEGAIARELWYDDAIGAMREFVHNP